MADGLSVGQAQGLLGGLGALVRVLGARLGVADPAETDTASAGARALRARLQSLDSRLLNDALGPALGLLFAQMRADRVLRASGMRALWAIERAITQGLPRWNVTGTDSLTGWDFTHGGLGQGHTLDAFLTRTSGFSSLPPPTRALSDALAASAAGISDPEGAFRDVPVENAPRVKFSFVGGTDYEESLPSLPIAIAVGLTGNENAWQLGGPDWEQARALVPGGTTRIRVYRTVLAPAADSAYIWDQDLPLGGPGTPLPAVILWRGDAQLSRFASVSPADWASGLCPIGAAWLFATALGPSPGGPDGPGAFRQSGLLSARNIALGPQGSAPGQTGLLGRATFNGAGDIRFTGLSFPRVPVLDAALLGAVGSLGLQARVTEDLEGTGTLTVEYAYYAPKSGFGSAQTDTARAEVKDETAGTVARFAIPADRLVFEAIDLATQGGFGKSGGTGSGALVIEAADREGGL
jgi:hypothetical protein